MVAAERFLVAVTGSERPYIFDLPQVLSLPPGFEFRFRYRADWISKDVVEALEADKGGFAGKKLLLFFHSRETRRLLPLRQCTIVKLERLGPVFFLRFRVGDFADCSNAANATSPTTPVLGGVESNVTPTSGTHDAQHCSRCRRAVEISATSKELILSGEQDLSMPLPAGSYLSFGNSNGKAFRWRSRAGATAEQPEEVSKHWGDAIDLLSHEEPELWGVPLFYLLGFQREDGLWQEAVRLSADNALSTHGYELVKDERYKMRVIEWRQDRPVHSLVKINCVFDPQVLSLEGSWDVVVGKYDVPEFTFSALRKGYSEVAIATAPLPAALEAPNPILAGAIAGAALATQPIPEGSGSAGVAAVTLVERRAAWPSYYSARVPVKVKLGAWNWVKAVGLILAGTAAFASPQICSSLAAGPVRSVFELVGLMLIVLGGGAFARDYAQVGGGLYRIIGGHGPSGS